MFLIGTFFYVWPLQSNNHQQPFNYPKFLRGYRAELSLANFKTFKISTQLD